MRKIKKITLSIIILSLLIMSSIVMVNATDIEKITYTTGNTRTTDSDGLELKVIKVAVLTGDKLITSGYDIFLKMLTDYQWIAGNIDYRLDVKKITDVDIFLGRLNTKNYDLVVVPGGGIGDGEACARCFPTLRNAIWKRNFANFIKKGGGYFSVCGGTALITDLDKKPRSFLEYAYEKSALGVTCVKSHYKTIGIPIFCELGGLPSGYVGVGDYVHFSGWNASDENIADHSGVCLDYQICKNNPIFDDYLESTRRITWIGGPSLVIPENPDRPVNVLAYYPIEEMSDNLSTRIHVWKYVGGIGGFIRASLKNVNNNYKKGTIGKLGDIFYQIGDWEMTDEIIQSDFANKPAMTAEIYPNENQARIVLAAPHTESEVWWGGHIEDAKDTDNNNLWDGLNGWVNVTSDSKTLSPGYNYWINRRSVAWVSKIVPENDLPPVYGPSQVSDIYPYVQNSSSLKIIGNAEVISGISTLDLYYRYSEDNSSNWSNWTLYGTDIDGSDGWSWSFNAPNGVGYYQFYSIRNVKYEDHTETETVPPGPDAMVRVVN